MAAVGNALGVVERLLCVGKELSHLLLALDIELSAGIAHAVFVGQLFAGLDTEQDIVGLRVLREGVVAVIRGDQRDPRRAADAQESGIDGLLVGVAVILQFEEEIALAEDIEVAQGRLAGALRIPADDLTRDLAGQAGGAGDNAFVKLPEQVQVHTGLIVEALREGPADDLHQVRVAGVVLRQEDQMVVAVVPVALLPVQPGPRRHVDLAADDRIDPLFFCRLIKIDHAVHDAVIGDGCCCHAQFLHPADVLIDLIGSVQKRVLCVDVEMCKGHETPLACGIRHK